MDFLDDLLDSMQSISVFRQDGSVQLPERKTTDAAAYDLYLHLPSCKGGYSISPLKTEVLPTGLHIALPRGYVGLVCSRSGHAVSGLFVTNAPGIIDSDYRGEVKVILTYIAHPDAPSIFVAHGQRIAQLLVLPARAVAHLPFVDVPSLEALPESMSTRTGGLGSTGK